MDVILTDGKNSKAPRGNKEGEWCVCVFMYVGGICA